MNACSDTASAGFAHPIRVTVAGGPEDHLVDVDDMTSGLQSRTGIYRGLCSENFPAAAMADAPKPLCPACRLVWLARLNLRTIEQRTGLGRRLRPGGDWGRFFRRFRTAPPVSRWGRGDDPRHALRPHRVPLSLLLNEQGR